MSGISYFESRSGKITCTAEKAFTFVTNIRNFERFIPAGTITDWQAERESCTFSVSMLGSVSIRVSHKEKFNKVVYNGDALKKNDFELVLHITDNYSAPAEVKVELNADLNPMMKMMAVKPIRQFLEMLIIEMGKFRDWEETKE